MTTPEYKLYYPGCECDEDWLDFVADMQQDYSDDAPSEEELDEMWQDYQWHLYHDEEVLPF